MHKMILDVQNDGLALILSTSDEAESKHLATVYRMKDRWHTELTSEHTRHAWSGPFSSPEDALKAHQAKASAPA